MDFAVERRLRALCLYRCGLGDGASAALARLLASPTLVSLEVNNEGTGPGRGVGALLAGIPLPLHADFMAAVRTSRLQRLQPSYVRLFDHKAFGVSLLAAVTDHPTLTHIDVSNNNVPKKHRAAVGAALSALVAANARALTSLNLSGCRLQDAGLGPLVDALPSNTVLRSLNCQLALEQRWRFDDDVLIQQCAVRLLAAVQANTGLRTLVAASYAPLAGLKEAEALVAARRQAETSPLHV